MFQLEAERGRISLILPIDGCVVRVLAHLPSMVKVVAVVVAMVVTSDWNTIQTYFFPLQYHIYAYEYYIFIYEGRAVDETMTTIYTSRR